MEEREALIDMINAWIKAPTFEDVEASREALLSALELPEQTYLLKTYLDLEPQFLRLCTRTYRNLEVHSTQQNEGYHVITKRNLSTSLSLFKAVQA